MLQERTQETLNSNLQVWCERLLILTFEVDLSHRATEK